MPQATQPQAAVPTGIAGVSSLGNFLPTTGGTLTGAIVLGGQTVPVTISQQTALGYGAAAGDTSTGVNSSVAIGYQALGLGPDTGGVNSAFGYRALAYNTSGFDNVALGTYALTANTTGQGNEALGVSALGENTTGNWNVSVGNQAMSTNVTGSANTALGTTALQSSNTSYNVAVGNGALQYATCTGGPNVAIGTSAMGFQNTTGGYNTAVGNNAMQNAETAIGNVAIGYAALQTQTSGNYNFAAGYNALFALTTGGNNIAIGYNTGYEGGGVAGNATATGVNNIWIGTQAGPNSNADPSYCLAIGVDTGCGGSGSVAIGQDSSGNSAYTSSANQFVLGTPNHTVMVPGTLYLATPGAFATGDKYLIYDPTTHLVHLSALGPAS